MATIINSTPWTSQPQQAVGIDWGNPITSGLVFALADNFRDSASNVLGSMVGVSAPTIAATEKGKAISFSGAARGTGHVSYPNASYKYGLFSGKTTLTLLYRPKSFSAQYGVLSRGASSSNFFNLSFYNSTQMNLIVGGSSSSGTIRPIYTWNVNKWYLIQIVFDGTFPLSASSAKFYINGVLQTSNVAASGAGSIGSGIGADLLLGYGYNPTYYLDANGDMAYCALHSRALSDAEVQSLSQNPWQIFKPIPRRIFVPAPTTGGLYTLTAQPGSYTVFGQQATLLRHRNLTAQSGSYSMTGLSAFISYVPVAAVYTLTAQSGSYSIAGLPAQLSRHRNLIAQSGSYVYTGFSAVISRTTLTPVYTLTALPGSYSIGGQSASILKHRILSASTGTYVYTGQSISINKYTPGSNTLVKYINVLTGEVLILKPI